MYIIYAYHDENLFCRVINTGLLLFRVSLGYSGVLHTHIRATGLANYEYFPGRHKINTKHI